MRAGSKARGLGSARTSPLWHDSQSTALCPFLAAAPLPIGGELGLVNLRVGFNDQFLVLGPGMGTPS